MIDEKKSYNVESPNDLTELITLLMMDVSKDNSYSEEERELARDIYEHFTHKDKTNGIIVEEEKDRAETRDEDLEEPETDDIER